MLNDLGHPFLSPIVRRDAEHRKGRLPQRLLLRDAAAHACRQLLNFSDHPQGITRLRPRRRPPSFRHRPAGWPTRWSVSSLGGTPRPRRLKPKTSENIRACRSSSDSGICPSCSIASNEFCSLKPSRRHILKVWRCFGVKSSALIMLPPSSERGRQAQPNAELANAAQPSGPATHHCAAAGGSSMWLDSAIRPPSRYRFPSCLRSMLVPFPSKAEEAEKQRKSEGATPSTPYRHAPTPQNAGRSSAALSG
jgi:hypothetical protein